MIFPSYVQLNQVNFRSVIKLDKIIGGGRNDLLRKTWTVNERKEIASFLSSVDFALSRFRSFKPYNLLVFHYYVF